MEMSSFACGEPLEHYTDIIYSTREMQEFPFHWPVVSFLCLTVSAISFSHCLIAVAGLATYSLCTKCRNVPYSIHKRIS